MSGQNFLYWAYNLPHSTLSKTNFAIKESVIYIIETDAYVNSKRRKLTLDDKKNAPLPASRNSKSSYKLNIY